jgi:hypothetical protein
MLRSGFWNRAIDRVLEYRDEQICTLPALQYAGGADGPPRARPSRNAPRGLLAGIQSEFVVASASLELAGQRIADRPPYALYRVAAPLRLEGETKGVSTDGWMGDEALYWRYATPGGASGQIEVALSRRGLGADEPTRAQVEVRRLPTDGGPPGPVFSARTGTVGTQGTRRIVLATPPPPFQTVVRVWPTYRAGADPRQLGAVVQFRFTPGRPPP